MSGAGTVRRGFRNGGPVRPVGLQVSNTSAEGCRNRKGRDRMTSRPKRFIAMLLLIVQMGGCYTWRPVASSPADFVASRRPDRVRLHTETPGDSARLTVVMRDPRLFDGNLSGYTEASPDSVQVIDLNTVTSLDRRTISGVGVALIAAPFVAFGAYLTVLIVAYFDCDTFTGCL